MKYDVTVKRTVLLHAKIVVEAAGEDEAAIKAIALAQSNIDSFAFTKMKDDIDWISTQWPSNG